MLLDWSRRKAYANWNRQLKERSWEVQQQCCHRTCRMFLSYTSSEHYQQWNEMLYLCKMRMNLASRSLRVSSLKRSLFTSERAPMSWKAEFIHVKMLSLWEVSRRISSGFTEQINFWTQKSIKSWKGHRFSAETTAKNCLDYDFVSLFGTTLITWRIELLIPWPNRKRFISKRGRILSLLSPI